MGSDWLKFGFWWSNCVWIACGKFHLLAVNICLGIIPPPLVIPLVYEERDVQRGRAHARYAENNYWAIFTRRYTVFFSVNNGFWAVSLGLLSFAIWYSNFTWVFSLGVLVDPIFICLVGTKSHLLARVLETRFYAQGAP